MSHQDSFGSQGSGAHSGLKQHNSAVGSTSGSIDDGANVEMAKLPPPPPLSARSGNFVQPILRTSTAASLSGSPTDDARSANSHKKSGIKHVLKDIKGGIKQGIKGGLHTLRQQVARSAKPPRRLTFTELSGVFKRLDANGDGELCFEEFVKIARKLKLDSEKLDGLLEQVFSEADCGNTNGSLDISEFRTAYNKLYTLLYCNSNSSGSNGDETFLRATRYGTRTK
jgi:hypothetical protein